MKDSSLKYDGNIQDSVAVTDISTINMHGDDIVSTGSEKLYGEVFKIINGNEKLALAA